MRRNRSILFLVVGLVCTLPMAGSTPLQAAQVPLSFAGNLTGLNTVLLPYFDVGDAFEGSIVFYASGIANSSADPAIGRYEDAITSATIKVGALDFTASSGTVVVANNAFGRSWDQIALLAGGGLVALAALAPRRLRVRRERRSTDRCYPGVGR